MGRPRKNNPISIGTRHGGLTVIGIQGRYLECRCDCGQVKSVREDHLQSGAIKSCGCYKVKVLKELGQHKATQASPLPGDCFGDLTVLEQSTSNRILCECTCGKIVTIRRDHLTRGATHSCGCKRNSAGGLSRTKEYRIWRGMLHRCHDPKTQAYHNYGARGIQVCPEWRAADGFQAFLNHIGPMPDPDLTVDRVDGTKGYSPGNVRWATRQEQARNQRRNHLITAFGKTQCLQAWEQEYGVKRHTIVLRMGRGWSSEDAVSLPKNSRRGKCRK